MLEESGGGIIIEAAAAPGYCSCNPAIPQSTTLHGASARADCRAVTMRAMACESNVALNPWLAVQHPDCRYEPSLLFWD